MVYLIDTHYVGNPDGIYDWDAIQENNREILERKNLEPILLKGALREFSEETGLTIGSRYIGRINKNPNVIRIPIPPIQQGRYRIEYEFVLYLENDEYNVFTQPLREMSSNMPQPEIRSIHFKKYLKYKNKYLQLKNKLKILN